MQVPAENVLKTKLLSEIGIEILSLLSVEQINEQVYSSINNLMDAEVFGIGVFDKEKNRLLFPSYLEKGVKMPFVVDLKDEDKLATQSFQNRELIIINKSADFKKYFKEAPSVVVGDVTQSILYAPLVFKDSVLGVITVQSFRENAYSDADIEMIRSLSVFVSTAVNNARIFESAEELVKLRSAELIEQKEELEKAYQNTRMLSEIGQKIVASLSVEAIVDDTYNSVKNLMDAQIFGIAVTNSTNPDILDFHVVEYDQKLPEIKLNIRDETRPGSICFNKQITVFFNDFDNEVKSISPNYIPPIQGKQAGSLIYIPLSQKGKKIGVITVQNYNKHVFTPQHLDILNTLAIYVTSAIENALLYGNMEAEVNKRTEEVVKQKQEIETAYEHIKILDEVGQQITSTFDFEIIFQKLHNSVSQLMSADVFGVRIYHPERNEIEIKYEYENGVRDAGFVISADNVNSYSTWCIKNKKEIFINDQEKEYKQYVPELFVISGNPTPANIFCPIMLGDKVLGILTVQSYKKHQYTLQHLHILKTLANYAAIALENASKYEKLGVLNKQIEDSFKNINILSEIGQQITATLNIDTILNVVFENIDGLMDATEFGVGIYNKEQDVLDVSHYIYEGKKIAAPGDIALVSMKGEGRLSVWCIKNKKEVFIDDIETDYHRFIPNLDAYRSAGVLLLNSLICLPLLIENEVIGIISVQSPNKKAYTRQHLEILRTLAAYTAIALDNALVYKKLDSALHEVERLSIVASKTTNTVIICKPDTEIEWANEAFERNSGYTLEEFKAKRGKTLLEISGRREIRQLVDECVKHKRSVSYESMNTRKDGDNTWFQTTLTPVFNESGELRNIVAIDSDITKIKRAEAELIRKNKDITDSINYARRIQNSILPSDEKILTLLPESFVLYKPRDIVSGDFYWVEGVDSNSKIIVAAVDCTGHGVPGAFLTIVGNSLLNQIINEQGISDPQQIIQRMNEGIIKRLSFTRSDIIRDGMDMAICIIDRSASELELLYSGAYNPMYYIRSGMLGETSPIRTSIGSMDEQRVHEITRERIKITKGDMIYLFTDGYADQLGEITEKKFLKSRFKQLLLDIHTRPLEKQKEALETSIGQWKGKLNQTDDILVMGIRV